MSALSNAVSYTGAAYDLFISYSHGDPRGTGQAPLANWTYRLIDELRRDIESTSTEFDQLAFWDDREADPALNLTPMLKDCVSNSALLLVVMSPRYLASPWCKDELEWFNHELRQRCEGEGHTLVVRASADPRGDVASTTEGHERPLLARILVPSTTSQGRCQALRLARPAAIRPRILRRSQSPLHDRDAALAEIEAESGAAIERHQNLHAIEGQADGLLTCSSS